MGKAYDTLLEKLQSNGFKVQHHGQDRARAQCPGHNGEDYNLSLAVGDQGVMLKCHSYDCPAEDVAKAVGLTLNDLFDAGGKAVYDYGNGHKVIRTRTRDGKKIVQSGHPGAVGPTTLYQHPDSEPITAPSEFVVLVEGEKSVDAALRLGWRCVTTWPGGAKGVTHVDLSPLYGKRIVIVADNDEPGFRAALELRQKLDTMAEVLGVWTAPGEFGCKRSVDDVWVDGGQIADLIAADLTLLEEPIEGEEQPTRQAVTTWMSEVESKSMKFLWDGIIPSGCLTVFAGQGGVAKSTFALWLAGQITKGSLKGALMGKPGRVLYISHEDSLAEVVKPRAVANGVVTEMLGQLGIYSTEIRATMVPRLPDDIDAIRDAIEKSGAKIVIIDPIASTISGDTDKVVEVRAALDPLNVIGQELGVSIIAIAHLRKGSGASSHLISGSHAYRDAARCVLLFAKDEEAGQTVFTVEKSNYGESGHSYSFNVEVVDHLTDSGEVTRVGTIRGVAPSALSAADVINASAGTATKGGKDKVTSVQVAAYIESMGNTAFRNANVEAEFPEAHGAHIRKLLLELKTRGLIASVGPSLWQATRFTDTAPPEPTDYCKVCGRDEPCMRQHTSEEYAAARARSMSPR